MEARGQFFQPRITDGRFAPFSVPAKAGDRNLNLRLNTNGPSMLDAVVSGDLAGVVA